MNNQLVYMCVCVCTSCDSQRILEGASFSPATSYRYTQKIQQIKQTTLELQLQRTHPVHTEHTLSEYCTCSNTALQLLQCIDTHLDHRQSVHEMLINDKQIIKVAVNRQHTV